MMHDKKIKKCTEISLWNVLSQSISYVWVRSTVIKSVYISHKILSILFIREAYEEFYFVKIALVTEKKINKYEKALHFYVGGNFFQVTWGKKIEKYELL